MRCDVGLALSDYLRRLVTICFLAPLYKYPYLLTWRKGNIEYCYSIVYYYNAAQRYEQFLQVGWLYQALILLGLALSSEHLCVFDINGDIHNK